MAAHSNRLIKINYAKLSFLVSRHIPVNTIVEHVLQAAHVFFPPTPLPPPFPLPPMSPFPKQISTQLSQQRLKSASQRLVHLFLAWSVSLSIGLPQPGPLHAFGLRTASLLPNSRCQIKQAQPGQQGARETHSLTGNKYRGEQQEEQVAVVLFQNIHRFSHRIDI